MLHLAELERAIVRALGPPVIGIVPHGIKGLLHDSDSIIEIVLSSVRRGIPRASVGTILLLVGASCCCRLHGLLA